MGIVILGIESSCDDTSAAILKDGVVLSNVIASQKVHEAYGGVVPRISIPGTPAKHYPGGSASFKTSRSLRR